VLVEHGDVHVVDLETGATVSASLPLASEETIAALGVRRGEDEPTHRVRRIAVSAEGRSIAIGGCLTLGEDDIVGTLWIWDGSREAPRLVTTHPGKRHSSPVHAVAFTKDGRLASCDARSVRLWDVSRPDPAVAIFAGTHGHGGGYGGNVGMHVMGDALWAYATDGVLYAWRLT
jgi:WD40 repeat protein